MKRFFVTRHNGAVEWAEQHGLELDRVNHLDVHTVRSGDEIYGTLPINLVAQVCEKGGRYFHLCMDIPESMRGKELSADMMNSLEANFHEFIAERIGD